MQQGLRFRLGEEVFVPQNGTDALLTALEIIAEDVKSKEAVLNGERLLRQTLQANGIHRTQSTCFQEEELAAARASVREMVSGWNVELCRRKLAG